MNTTMPAREHGPVLQKISAQQRRARLGVRHHLAHLPAATKPDPTPADIATDLVALHATDPASVYLSVAARSARLTAEDVTHALYDDRTVVRMLGMRRTMFVVPTSLVPIVQRSSSEAIAARLRRALVKELAAVVPDPENWLTEVSDATVARLQESGGATGLALSRADPRLRTKLMFAEGKSYGGPASINTRVLNILSAQGRIVRGRPGGQWTGSQYEWASMETWLPADSFEIDVEQARTELVRRWLARFGPATMADISWWTGWNLGDTRRAMAGLPTTVVDLDGVEGLALADDVDVVADPEPWIALLPALDPTPMGWQGRDWYISPEHRPALFDRTGNIGPTVWCDGRVVGGWAQRPDGEVAFRLLEDIGRQQSDAVQQEATRLAGWLEGVTVIPKFRTPLERELAAS
jgi:hypothetical protein